MIFNSFQFSVFSFKKVLNPQKSLALLFSLLFSIVSYGQFDIPEKPSDKEQHFFYDYTTPKLLESYYQNALETKLTQYADTTSTQIVIAIIDSTNGEDINFLGAQWGHKWGVGQEKEDNGVLILLAKNDRKIAISTGYGVEHILTDATCKLIIENDILPYFKQDNYFGGLNNGVDRIFEALQGEYKASPKPQRKKGVPGFFIIAFIILIFILIKGNRGGKGGSGRWIGGYGSGSYGGGFGSGGSFGGGGFGGGGFGGGGASGGW